MPKRGAGRHERPLRVIPKGAVLKRGRRAILGRVERVDPLTIGPTARRPRVRLHRTEPFVGDREWQVDEGYVTAAASHVRDRMRVGEREGARCSAKAPRGA